MKVIDPAMPCGRACVRATAKATIAAILRPRCAPIRLYPSVARRARHAAQPLSGAREPLSSRARRGTGVSQALADEELDA